MAALLAAAAIVAGVIGARRDDFAGGASGDWSRAVRVEIKRSLATTSAFAIGGSRPGVLRIGAGVLVVAVGCSAAWSPSSRRSWASFS